MLATLLENNADRLGARTALVYGDEHLSHTEFADKVDRVAHGLTAVGVGPGDTVLLILPNCPEFVLSFFALARIGAAAVLLDVASKQHELTTAITDCRPRGVITDRQMAGSCQAIAEALGQALVVVTTDGVPSSAVPFHGLLSPVDESLPPMPEADAMAVYQYSSGSTGRPKRVGRTQAQCLAEAGVVGETIGLTPDDGILCTVPLYHAYGLGDCLLTAVGSGAKLVLQQHVQPFIVHRRHTLELISTEGVTVFPSVPFMVDLLANSKGHADLSNLRYCFSAGNALPRAAGEAFLTRFGVPVRSLYGCTECPSISVDLDDPTVPGSVGGPMRGVTIAIRDASGDAIGPGEIGEVAVKSPAAAAGYVGIDDQRTFVDGWVLPGDVGSLDADGRLSLRGRTKVFIDVVGHKVDPVEVEDVLLTHPSVAEVVVIGTMLDSSTEVVKAAVVTRDPCSERELTHFCTERLAPFKVPQVIEFRDEIPRSALGKVLRKELV